MGNLTRAGIVAILVLQIISCKAPFTRTPAADPPACTPIDPQAQELPAHSCFSASLTGPGSVELNWQVNNAQFLIYIYDDTGPNYRDPGYYPAYCPGTPNGACSASITVPRGGRYRWLLMAEHDTGARFHVPVTIDVPPLSPLHKVSGGGFVDVLAPTEQSISWTASEKNAPLDAPLDEAWVEIRHGPGNLFPRLRKTRPRSGSGATYQVSAADLQQGSRSRYTVFDCIATNSPGNRYCSGSKSVGFITEADRFLNPDPLYLPINGAAELAFTTISGEVRRLSSDTLLPEQGFVTDQDRLLLNEKRLTPGNHRLNLASCDETAKNCVAGQTLQVVVDAPVDWELGRDYRQDFESATGFREFGGGDPLDITYDDEHGIWLLNEFSNSVEYADSTRAVSSINLPLARQSLDSSAPVTISQPFVTGFFPGADVAVSYSELGERITTVGKDIWFVQGGGMVRDGKLAVDNQSRIFSLNRARRSSPRTAFDDRLCAYNMPRDESSDTANSQVIGLAAARGRIWVAESRGLFGTEPSVISSFVPDPENCGNLLDFNNPGALRQQNFQYCLAGETPEHNNCIEKYSLEHLPEGIKVAHLATDPTDETLWFTDARGRFLGHLDPDRSPVITLYPLTPKLTGPNNGTMNFRDFPWSLRVQDDAVYFSEYNTSEVVRFDKSTLLFHEIQVPVATADVKLHSIDLDARTDRLWFTLSNEPAVPLDPNSSTIGYIDLDSWRKHVAAPDSDIRVKGVVYSGLSEIPPTDTRPDYHQAFRGIAIDPKSGNIALATMQRKQITELVPRSAFRCGSAYCW